jgi:sugar/nucleoside kinase (ribokinase family)
VGSATFATGGAVSNTGFNLVRLGIPTRLVAKIGDDSFGQLVAAVARSYHPTLADDLSISPAGTAYTVIINAPGIDRIFLHHTGANDTFGPEDIDSAVVAQAAVFHLGYPPLLKRMYTNEGCELAQVMQRAKETGVTTSLDMTLPDASAPAGQVNWDEIYHRTLPYTDLFLPSIEELLFTLRRSTFDQLTLQANNRRSSFMALVTPGLLSDLSLELLDRGVCVVMIKLGERGIYLRTAGQAALAHMGRAAPPNTQAWADRELWAPAFQVEVSGTTGAGDASIAGFLSALLRGADPEESITFATALGAYNVEAPDALGGVRTWEETRQRITTGWPRRRLQLDDPGWHWKDGAQTWGKEKSASY